MFKLNIKILINVIKKRKIVFFVNLIGLATAITSCYFIYKYVSYELSFDKHFKNTENIYRITFHKQYEDGNVDNTAGTCPAIGPYLKKNYPSVEQYVRFLDISHYQLVVTYKDKVFREDKVYYCDPSVVDVFSLEIIHGERETALEGVGTAIISESVAKKYFGEENPVGKEFKLSERWNNYLYYTVKAVFKDVPPNSHLKYDFLLSYKTLESTTPKAINSWSWNNFLTYIKVTPETDMDHLTKEAIPKIIKEMYSKYNDIVFDYKFQSLGSIHLHSKLRHETKGGGNAFFVNAMIFVAVIILVFAWLNYISLFIATSYHRLKEIAVKKTFGANKFELTKQFVIETLFLNILSLIIVGILIYFLSPFFEQISGIPHGFKFTDFLFFKVVLVLIVLTVLISIYPSQIISSYNTIKIFKDQFQNYIHGMSKKKIFVVIQLSILLLLIAIAVTIKMQIQYMLKRGNGADMTNVLVVKAPIVFDEASASSVTNIKNFLDELRKEAFVEKTTCFAITPGEENGWTGGGYNIEGQKGDGKRVFFNYVDYNFYDFFKIDLVAGSFPVYGRDNQLVINKTAADLFGYNNYESIIGKMLISDNNIGTIVGVVENYHQRALKYPIEPTVFQFGDGNGAAYMAVKINAIDFKKYIPVVNDVWSKVYPENPFDYYVLDEYFNKQYQIEERFKSMFTILSICAIFLMSLGVLGLSISSFERKKKEIGIRKVHGATSYSIYISSLIEYSKLVLMASIISYPFAYYLLLKWFANYAYIVKIGVWFFVYPIVIVLLVIISTISYQVIKLARLSPTTVIKSE